MDYLDGVVFFHVTFMSSTSFSLSRVLTNIIPAGKVHACVRILYHTLAQTEIL